MKPNFDIGLIGIAVMGENLALNIESRGFSVTVSSRNQDTIDSFVNGRAKGKNIQGTTDIQALVQSLSKPRKVMLMVKAGNPVDQVISQLVPLLEPGDVIIDGGNSLYTDTTRRMNDLEAKGLLFVGAGVSGGEEGALTGPSIMPGGSEAAWPIVQPILQAIAARTEDDSICCDWVGDAGAGHFVKMVHNGIEYGDMQLISESYQLLKDLLGYTPADLAPLYEKWNETELDSYLIEITSQIFKVQDRAGGYLVDYILDSAMQKGTGKWTIESALGVNSPLTLISEAVFARLLAAMKNERVVASDTYRKRIPAFEGNRDEFAEQIRQALYAAKMISYAQGFSLMRLQAKAEGWKINYGSVALMWRGGCIIRSRFLDDIKRAFDKEPELPSLLLDRFFVESLKKLLPAWRQVVATAALHGVPVPTLSSALSFFDGYTTGRLPANLLQAQRDFFGAHTYERLDRPRGEFFHTNWTGRGGDTASTTYNV
jgi:6-phosphogluconate dehydrogenase